MKKYNKGEWSELYAICKMLYDQAVVICDDKLAPTDEYIQILKLLMKSIHGAAEYDVNGKANGDVSVVMNGRVIKDLRIRHEEIEKILGEIHSGSGASFVVPSGDRMMDKLDLDEFKASSQQKADIEAIAHFPQDDITRKTGFSIKSQIGSPPTLLNASQATNFLYKITGFNGNVSDVNAINTSSKVKDRIKAIYREGGEFEYFGMENSTFEGNLRMIDTNLPQIVSDMLMVFYVGNGVRTLHEIVKACASIFDTATEQEIIKKTKDLLANITLGMIPKSPWDGSSLGGGCIFVKDDGNIVCFTLYDMDAFKEYLINNTKFDTPSTTRHKFGELFRGNDGELYFKLCLDIRFLH